MYEGGSWAEEKIGIWSCEPAAYALVKRNVLEWVEMPLIPTRNI